MDKELYILLGLSVSCATFAAFFLVHFIRERAAVARRTQEVYNLELLSIKHEAESLVGRVSHVAALLRERLGFIPNDSLRDRLRSAGYYNPHAADLYISIRVIAPAVAMLAALILTQNIVLLLVVAGVCYLLPDIALERMVKACRQRIRRALPDSVDLLVVCMDAGLGVDEALLRSAKELKIAYPDLCRELILTNQEQQVGVTRLTSWKNLARRTRSPELDQMVSMLIQADRFGTPIAEALRAFADSLRIQRKQAAEERASKSAVILLFPLVLFIFPVVFVVLLGPAILELIQGLSRLGQ